MQGIICLVGGEFSMFDNNIKILKKQSEVYVSRDYVANKIRKRLDGAPLYVSISIYTNGEWSFYFYTAACIPEMVHDGLEWSLIMRGTCFYENSSGKFADHIDTERDDFNIPVYEATIFEFTEDEMESRLMKFCLVKEDGTFELADFTVV